MNYQSIINRDFKSRHMETDSRLPMVRPVYLAVLGLVLAFSAVFISANPQLAGTTRHVALLPIPSQALALPEPTAAQPGPEPAEIEEISATAGAAAIETTETAEAIPAPEPEPEPDGIWHEVTVKSGDSLARIFSRLDIAPQQLHKIVSQGGAARNLKKIYPGQTIQILTSADQGLLMLSLKIDELSALEVSRQGDEFEVSTQHRTPERRMTHASGAIESSLFLAAQDAGMSDNLTMELASIFGWDIDFALDIREGDQFTVLYEELYLDAEKIGNGEIIAAEFVTRDRTFQAFQYTDNSGKTDYYSLDGKSLRKAFLRTPVEFSRISSRFSLGRKHPILNRLRAHKGVDYAAPTGTPIKVTGGGKIIHRGKKGGYGNTIIVQHGSTYSTLYAHLSRFRSGLKVGSRVQQGDVIGYIGRSGLATGPHLHYEFRVNGAHRDPLRVKLPGAEPLNRKYLSDFQTRADALLARLDLVRSVQVASSE